jgi:serine/threonine protein kinase
MPTATSADDARPDPSDLIPLQNAPGSSRSVAPNTDDAPTIITQRNPTPSDPSLGLAIGSFLGQFEILDSVGVGGMAAVLKARDRELGRVVALKILPPHMAKDVDSITRFKQEARAAAQLDHTNVARVFACGEDQGLQFIAFEYVEGENLRNLIEQRGAFPPAEAVTIMLQVAAGLSHAAARGVVHRDIKPSNIVVTPDGRAKIVDMGLARNLLQSVSGGVTQSGVTLGTFDYISPEQALDPRRADVRSDIYSLGCSFYHAITGRPPVPPGTAARKLHFHQHESVLDPRVIVPTLPDEVAIVMAKMMAKDPAKRYQTAQELIVDLTQLARLLNVSPDVMPAESGSVAQSAEFRILPETPKVPLALLVGITALVVAVLVFFSLSGNWWTTPVVTKAPDGEAGLSKTLPSAEQPIASPPAVTEATSVNAMSLEQLVAALKNPAITEIRLEPGQRYDFTQIPAGLVATGKKLTLEPRPGVLDFKNGTPILRLAAVARDALAPGGARAQSLTFSRYEQLTLRGLTIEIVDGPDAELPGLADGLVLQDVGQVEFAECRFDAATPLSAWDITGVTMLTTPGTPAAQLRLKNDYFGLRRGVAAMLVGRIKVEATECAFPAHLSCFSLQAEGEATETTPGGELNLRCCSFLLETGSVAEIASTAKWQVSAGYCVFAVLPPDPTAMPMMMSDNPERKAAVVRYLGTQPMGLLFAARTGERNAYFRVDPFALGERNYSFAQCQQTWSPAPARDAGAIELRSTPWATDPVPLMTTARPWEALRLKTTLAALRVPKADVVILGAKDLPRADTKMYDPWPPATQDASIDPKLKIVYPNAEAEFKGEVPRHVYLTLDAAIADAKNEDLIQIRHDGPLEIPQTTIDKPRLRLTIKPYPGAKPVLLSARDNNKVDGSLIRLVEGQLTLEGLEFRLKPRTARPGDVRTLAVVSVVAGRDCTLKNCTVTLEERENASELLAAVVLTDAEGEMRTGTTPTPNLVLEQCLLRGRGRGVLIAASRPFDLTLKNSITALAGPVLDVDPAVRNAVNTSVAHVRFDQLTALLGGPLLDFKPRREAKPSGWVPVEVSTSRCLFAAFDDQPLVTIDGGDPANLSRILRWENQRSNWYTGFASSALWLQMTPDDDTLAVKNFSQTEWFTMTNETPESLGKVRFNDPPASLRKFATVEANQLMIEKSDLPGDAGAMWPERE